MAGAPYPAIIHVHKTLAKFSQHIFGVCSRFLGNKMLLSRTLQFFLVNSSLTLCSLCYWICKKKTVLIVLILGGDWSWTKIPCKTRQLWWQEKMWGKQPEFFIKMHAKRGFKCLSLWGRSCWADGWADARVGQTRVGQTRFLIWILEFEFGFWILGVWILEGIWPHGWVQDGEPGEHYISTLKLVTNSILDPKFLFWNFKLWSLDFGRSRV